MAEKERRYARTPRGKYQRHKQNARARGVGFTLTFNDWWQLWCDSGHWQERGGRKGQYAMLRFNDAGAYALGNVRIARMEVNTAECNRTRHGKPAWAMTDEDYGDSVPF